MVTDDDAPVVMYRQADDNGYLVTALVDRATPARSFADLAERPASPFVSRFLTAQTLAPVDAEKR